MPDDQPPRLSALLEELGTTPRSRRAFLARASALGAVLPVAGAALVTGCAPQAAPPRPDTTDTAGGVTGARTQNANSKLDTAYGTGGTPTVTTGAAAGQPVPYRRYDPTLPALSAERTLRLQWTARELPMRVSPDTVVAAWTFEGDIPGPIVHCRVGDTVEITLRNEGAMPHSIDFHSSQVNPKVAFRSILKGQSLTYSFRPRYAGAFLYHCGTAPVLMHIGSGMYGACIVSPRTPLPPAREFVLVQSEFYLAPAQNGVRAFDYTRMLSGNPDIVAFNGRPSQYQAEPIRVRVGDRVRFYVVSAGPTHSCAFHVVGEQFDTVYLGAPPENALRGVQTFDVPAGGGMIFDLIADVPGEFPFVNHAFGHGQKGAIGFLVVEP